eukprot:10717582-Alexandrium_andersonii.AAC.1
MGHNPPRCCTGLVPRPDLLDREARGRGKQPGGWPPDLLDRGRGPPQPVRPSTRPDLLDREARGSG